MRIFTGLNAQPIYTFFDGAQVRLVHQHKESKGEVIGTEGFDLYLKIDAFIGQEVDELDIYNEPWELLQALIDRLTEAKDYKQKIVRIKRLMRGDVLFVIRSIRLRTLFMKC